MSEGHFPQMPQMPLVEAAGTTRQCGRQLGETWRDMLQRAQGRHRGEKQWWRQPQFRGLVDRIAPHLDDFYVGMAEGAQLGPDEFIPPVPLDMVPGCTSFAIAPEATADGHLICGQTKDVRAEVARRYLILKILPTDAPPAITMTYPGMLFGHGFTAGRCAIFRNSIAINPIPTVGALPYMAWGILALHCRTVDEVCALTERGPVAEPFHVTVADEQGGIVGIEHADGETAFLRPTAGLYTHANNIVSGGDLLQRECCGAEYQGRSQHRRDRLMRRLQEDQGRSTAESAQRAITDHDGYPYGVCNHESERFCTTAALVAQPTLRRMVVTSGPPCCNPGKGYRLDG